MSEFFKPWRRKIGVLALLMSCVSIGGWLRSRFTQDTFTMGFGSSSYCKLVSVSDRILIANVSMDEKLPIQTVPWTSQKPRKNGWEIVLPLPDRSKLVCMHPFSEDLYSTGNDEMGANFISFAIKWCQFPYWFVALPLTALSAFLLISRPRQSTQKKLPEPIRDEGGGAS